MGNAGVHSQLSKPSMLSFFSTEGHTWTLSILSETTCQTTGMLRRKKKKKFDWARTKFKVEVIFKFKYKYY